MTRQMECSKQYHSPLQAQNLNLYIPDFPKPNLWTTAQPDQMSGYIYSSEALTSRALLQQTLPQPTIEPKVQTLTQSRGQPIIFSKTNYQSLYSERPKTKGTTIDKIKIKIVTDGLKQLFIWFCRK